MMLLADKSLRKRKLPRMTEAEFLEWCTDFWAEWVDGEVITMSPVKLDHAEISLFVLHLLGMFAQEIEAGRVLAEPYQIRFADQKRRRSPDVFFVKHINAGRFKETELEGPADLIVEVVSPSTRKTDYGAKHQEYERAGVGEYWIIDPILRQISVSSLGRDKKYHPITADADRICSNTLPGFYLKSKWFWPGPPPKVSICLREMLRRRKSR